MSRDDVLWPSTRSRGVLIVPLAEIGRARTLLQEHSNDVDERRCLLCNVSRCTTYRTAWALLYAAGVSVPPLDGVRLPDGATP